MKEENPAMATKRRGDEIEAPAFKRSKTNEAKPFPRGVLNLVPKRPSVDQKQDYLFGPKTVVLPRKKPQKRKGTINFMGGKKKKAKKEVKQKYLEDLTFRRLQTGDLFLGVVKEINATDLAVSLPNSFTGYCSIREVSDGLSKVVDAYVDQADSDSDDDALPSLEKMFRVGQLVRVVVIDLQRGKGGRRVELSMRCSLVNKGLTLANFEKGVRVYGAVKSKEDRGYVIDLGIPVPAFMKFKDWQSGSALIEGQPIDLWVKSKGESSLNLAQIGEGQKVKHKLKGCIMSTLKPGFRVACQVTKVLANGVEASFFKVLSGTVDLLHLNVPIDQDWTAKFKSKKKFKAVIIHVSPDNKKSWTLHETSPGEGIQRI